MAIATDSALLLYIRRANAFPRLLREEELELWHRWQRGQDDRAKDELVRSTLHYAVAIARKYHRYGLPLAELIAEGNFGIVKALSKFEPERGNRFATYAAFWIRAYILSYILRCWSLVGSGTAPFRSKLFFKLRRERIRIHNLVGEGAHADELLAERFGVSREKMVGIMQRLDSRDLSLDLNVSDDTKVSIVDRLLAPDCNQEQMCMTLQESCRVRNVVRTALDVLDKRERLVVEYHLMRDSEDEVSLAGIGRLLGVSRERTRQLEARALCKLRRRILELYGDENRHGFVIDSAA